MPSSKLHSEMFKAMYSIEKTLTLWFWKNSFHDFFPQFSKLYQCGIGINL